MAAFDTFVKKQETVAFPKEPFYLRCGSSAEEKESPGGKQVFMELPFNDRGQGIDAISEIGPAALCTYEDNAAYPHRIIILILSGIHLFYAF